MSLNVHTPSTPPHLRLTQSMWEDFLCDPVMAAHVIMGVTLDVFQRARLRYYWWMPNLIDESGFSTGKTIVDWVYVNLRCLLIPDHHAGVYYPVFQTGKDTFWLYYDRIRNSAPLYRAQLGRIDEKGDADDGKSQGAACYKAFYKNDSIMMMPAPSFMKSAQTQASLRFNTLLVEEWTHIDESSDGIDAQLIGRCTRPSFNQHHPIWQNHIHFTAPAKPQHHPSFVRFNDMLKRVKRGDPQAAVLSYSYKDYSNLTCPTGKTYREEYRIEATLKTMKSKRLASGDRAGWLGEGLGIRAKGGKGWFTEEAIANCVELGKRRGLLPVSARVQDERVVAE